MRAPSTPTPKALLPLPRQAVAIVANATTAFVGNAYGMVYVVSVGAAVTPTLLATYTGAGANADVIRALAIAGSHLFVGNNSDGLHTIDISDPAHPTLAGTPPIDGDYGDYYSDRLRATAIAIAGDLAFVANPRYSLATVDIAVPTSLSMLDRLETNATLPARRGRSEVF